jgi:LysR family transcriptional activator of nhaA
VANQYKVNIIGQTEEIKEQFFAITTERRLSNPALIAINETAEIGCQSSMYNVIDRY